MAALQGRRGKPLMRARVALRQAESVRKPEEHANESLDCKEIGVWDRFGKAGGLPWLLDLRSREEASAPVPPDSSGSPKNSQPERQAARKSGFGTDRAAPHRDAAHPGRRQLVEMPELAASMRSRDSWRKRRAKPPRGRLPRSGAHGDFPRRPCSAVPDITARAGEVVRRRRESPVAIRRKLARAHCYRPVF